MRSHRCTSIALGASILMLAKAWDALAPGSSSLSRLEPLRIPMPLLIADLGGAPATLPQGHGHRVFNRGRRPPHPAPTTTTTTTSTTTTTTTVTTTTTTTTST